MDCTSSRFNSRYIVVSRINGRAVRQCHQLFLDGTNDIRHASARKIGTSYRCAKQCISGNTTFSYGNSNSIPPVYVPVCAVPGYEILPDPVPAHPLNICPHGTRGVPLSCGINSSLHFPAFLFPSHRHRPESKFFCQICCSGCMIKMSMCQQNCHRCTSFLTHTLRQLLGTVARINNDQFFCLIIDCKIAVGLYRPYHIVIYFNFAILFLLSAQP